VNLAPPATRYFVAATPAAAAGLLLLRLTAGGWLLPHGLGKLFGWFGGPGLAGFTHELVQFGLPATTPWPGLIACLQTGLGLALLLGLRTRLSASVAALFLAVTVVLNRDHGWFWMNGGMEFPLFWTMILVAIALLGAGPWSVDGRWRGGRAQTS
jgi:putative oxidoreductase